MRWCSGCLSKSDCEMEFCERDAHECEWGESLCDPEQCGCDKEPCCFGSGCN